MKIIGVEIRVGTTGGVQARLFEAKLVPLEIEYPEALLIGHGPAGFPAFNVTVHTSGGDMTTSPYMLNPAVPANWERARQYSEAQIREALDELGRRVARA
jgi:hypothetical protein